MNKNKSGGMYIFWSASIVLCLLLVLFSLLFSSCAKNNNTVKASVPSVSESQTPDASPTAPADPNATADPGAAQPPATQAPVAQGGDYELGETEDAGQAYLDKLVFLGDSTTYGLQYYGMLTGGKQTTQVWVPSNATLALFNQSTATIVYPETGEEMLIADAAGLKKPEYLVITLGVNGVSSMDEDYFKSEYSALIQRILAASPDTKIILNSIYPVMSTYDQLKYINNENIPVANGWIRDIAQANGVKFLNSASAVTGADGSLPGEYCNDNALHLNADGFNLILTYMRTHAYL